VITTRLRRLAGPAGLCLLVAAAGAAEPNADDANRPRPPTGRKLSVPQIVRWTNYVSYYQGDDGRAKVRMTIVDAQERRRHREFTILRWDQPSPPDANGEPNTDRAPFCGDQKFYVYFRRPADVNKTAFLVWKHLDRQDDRWLYSPALDLVNRIAASDKRTSFVGSHFFYEDVSGRSINDDRHELLEEASNQTYYVLKNTPKDPSTVEFAYYKMWIHRKTFLVVQTSYYTKDDKEYRRYNALKVRHIQGYPTVVKSRMSDLASGGWTELTYDEVRYDVGIPEAVFAERYLRKPPFKHLE
jgi:hypothetical protein